MFCKMFMMHWNQFVLFLTTSSPKLDDYKVKSTSASQRQLRNVLHVCKMVHSGCNVSNNHVKKEMECWTGI